MAKKKVKKRKPSSRRVVFRRRRTGLTNYKKRLQLIISRKPRLVIRVSNKYINCQVIKYKSDGDVTIIAFNSKNLINYGFKGSKNLQSAYLTGLVAGLKALKEGIKKAVLDTGLKPSVKNSRIYACLKGFIEAGVSVPHGDEVMPDDKLLKKDELTKYITKVKKGVK
jgi:large subunit ribosomal protein L18